MLKQTFDLRSASGRPPRQAAAKPRKAIGCRAPAIRDASADAKTRLLDAALELFGARGFSDTGVRELAAAARVNVAAVSYHFGSKDRLRIEALRYGFAPITPITQKLRDTLDQALQEGTTEAAETALRSFVGIFLKEAVGREGRHWAMFMRERLTPGPALEMVMREFFAPIGKILAGIVRTLLPGAGEQQVHLCVASIISQCVHVRSSEPMLRFFSGKDPRSGEYRDLAAAHIADFSIQALRGMRQSPVGRAR